MNSITATPRLERPREGRMLAGSAAGIARHLNVDPTLVRLGFVVAVLAGGLGFAAYIASWLLIPEEGSEDAVLHVPANGKASRWAGFVLLAIGIVAALDTLDGDGIADDLGWASLLAIAGGYLVLRAQGDTAPVTSEMPTPMGPSPEPAPTADAPRSRVATRTVAGGLLLLLAALTALGAAGVDLGWQEWAGIAVAAAGATLVAGSFFGASPWLALPPLVLAAAVAAMGAAGATFDGPIGERSFAPAQASALPDEYRVAIGQLDVDLRDTTFAEGTTTRLKVHVGIGETTVQIPDDVAVRIDAHAGAGEIHLPGGDADGTDVDRDETITAPGRPVLELDVEAGFGEVRVERATGPDRAPVAPTPPGA
ncbi:MAG: PspC domain-containing protein [Solirubrobacteraceae bacterium]